ncbi:MAG: YfhO family protein, partial [Candidatus Altiarchaeota archaeon]
VKISAVPAESKEYRGEAYLLEGNGDARIIQFTPNRVVVKVQASGEDRLILNQNYFKGWKVKGNMFGRVEAKNGLVSTLVEPGENEIVFYYLPESFVLGAVISITALLACSIFCLRQGSKAAKYGGP